MSRHVSRHVRVFVSSTFTDMQDERDHLTRFAFPELRSRCEGRGIVWGEVDLRWGIDEARGAEVLPRCLEEIADCQPFFIGLLGDRYGSLVDLALDEPLLADLLGLEPWLRDHDGASLTEVEMWAALRDPETARCARFYFRDPPRAGDERVDALRRSIAGRGCHCSRYATAEELGQLVIDELWTLIEERFPKASEPDWLDAERAYHEAMTAALVPQATASGRTAGAYVPRWADFARLDHHVAGEGPPLAVTGPAGQGKSALLANWVAKLSAARPDLTVITHHVGASPDSVDWAGTVRRLIAEIQRHLGVPEAVPEEQAELRAAFVQVLDEAAELGKLVIVVDGLDQLEDREGARDLVWLPEPPAGIRLILATRPGRSLAELTQRAWPTLEVAPLDGEERTAVVRQYLDWWGKRLSDEQTRSLAEAPPCANPLFLSAVLNELRLFGSAGTELDTRIGHYLAARSTGDLFDRILARYEDDYDGARPGLTSDALAALAAARRGLSEAELIDVLGSEGDPLPHDRWSPLRLAARPYLVDRSGFLGFGHPEFRAAVEARFEDAIPAAHAALARYFQRQHRFHSRRVEELPAQLAGAREWPGLYELLSDEDYQFVAGFWRPLDAERYWAILETESSYRRVDAFAPLIESLDDDIDRSLGELTHIMQVGRLLNQAGHHDEAFRVRSFLVDYYEQTPHPELVHWALNDSALAHRARGEYDEALADLRRRQRIELTEDVPEDEKAKTLNNLGMVLGDLGRWVEALDMHREQERFAVEIGNERMLSGAYGNQARATYALGDLEDAIRLFREQERICRTRDDFESLSHSLGNQAALNIELGNLDRAEELLDEHEEIAATFGDRAGLAMCALRRAMLAFEAGDLATAEARLDEADDMCRETGNPEPLQGIAALRSLIEESHAPEPQPPEPQPPEPQPPEPQRGSTSVEEAMMRLLGKKRKADMEYVEFTTKFVKTMTTADAAGSVKLLDKTVLCPNCDTVVSPEMVLINSTNDAMVRCSSCHCAWIRTE